MNLCFFGMDHMCTVLYGVNNGKIYNKKLECYAQIIIIKVCAIIVFLENHFKIGQRIVLKIIIHNHNWLFLKTIAAQYKR